jgi:hypothetical protein
MVNRMGSPKPPENRSKTLSVLLFCLNTTLGAWKATSGQQRFPPVCLNNLLGHGIVGKINPALVQGLVSEGGISYFYNSLRDSDQPQFFPYFKLDSVHPELEKWSFLPSQLD